MHDAVTRCMTVWDRQFTRAGILIQRSEKSRQECVVALANEKGSPCCMTGVDKL